MVNLPRAPVSPNTPRLSGDERRSAIVDAVLEMAAEVSPARISTTDIGRAVGLSQGAVFKHFACKEDIWLAVAETVAERLMAVVDGAVRQATSPLAALHDVFMAHVDFVVANPGVPRFIFHELQPAAETPVKRCIRALMGGYRQRLMALLGELETAGQLADGVDKQAAAGLFLGSIQGLIMQSMLASRDTGIRAQAGAVVAIYERGIRRAS